MSDSRNALAEMPRGSRNALAGALRDKASEIAGGLVGAPGSVWGELMNAIMAGGRSVMPGGGSYEDELQRIYEAREEQYPGAYSVIDEVRLPARRQAREDDMLAQATGMSGPIMFHGSPKALIRRFKGDRAGLSYFAEDPKISADYGKHVGRYDVKTRHTLDLGDNPYDTAPLEAELRSQGRADLADRVAAAQNADGPSPAVFHMLRDPEITAALRPAHDSFRFVDDHNEFMKPSVMAVFPDDVPIRLVGRKRATAKKGRP